MRTLVSCVRADFERKPAHTMKLQRQMSPSVLNRTRYEIPRASIESGVSSGDILRTAMFDDRLEMSAIGSELLLTAIAHAMTILLLPSGTRNMSPVTHPIAVLTPVKTTKAPLVGWLGSRSGDAHSTRGAGRTG